MGTDTLSVLVTGGAGFIGSHLTGRLLERGDRVTIVDNFNSFYNPEIKRANISEYSRNTAFQLIEGDIRDTAELERVFASESFDVVVHLAALAGVRPSVERPAEYMDVNVVGTQRLIDQMVKQAARSERLPRLVFASSSSVYGERADGDFSEDDRTDRALSPYGASKKAGEVLCHAAHHTIGLSALCIRLFTVYGPRQRPDLAIHKFCRLIDQGKPIDVYGDGLSKRDYTYVKDTVSGITGCIDLLSKDQPLYEIINLGRSEPIYLSDMIASLESSLGKMAKINRMPMQVGDVPYTCANIDKARRLLGYDPSFSLAGGIDEFVKWYRQLKTKTDCQSAAT